MKIAILGTGMVGNAIGTKLVQLGHQVTMGSRTATSDAGQQWLRSVGGAAQIGTFADAAAFGDIARLGRLSAKFGVPKKCCSLKSIGCRNGPEKHPYEFLS